MGNVIRCEHNIRQNNTLLYKFEGCVIINNAQAQFSSDLNV